MIILRERGDLWQPRQQKIPSKKGVRTRFYLLLPYHLIGIAMCYFLVSGLFAIVDWLSRMWGLEIIPDDAPWWVIPAATMVIYPLLFIAYKEEVEG